MRYDAMTPNAIEATGLVKRFGKTMALDGVDLVANQGRVLGMLGPNGAGKTTAVRILATLLRPDGGEASVCGYDVVRDAHQVRQLIGLTGQYASLDEGLSGTNNLIMIGRLLGLPRPEARARAGQLLARFDLTEAAARPVKTYSGGMRRRLDLAASLVGNPRVLYLDEPTTGLDPRSRTDVWGMIRGLVADGVTVLLTSQYLDEADQLANDIVVIDHGKVVATGTPDELKARIGGRVLQVSPADPARMAEVTTLLGALSMAEVATDAETGVATVPVNDATLVPHIFRELDDRGIELTEFTLRKASLDDRFRSLPIARWAPLAGAVLGDMVRYLISIAITIGFGMILGFRVTTNPAAAVAGVLLLLAFALAMCWVSALIGMLVKTPQGVQAFGFIVFFPLVFGSNLFAPTATMPGWLQAFVRVNPMTVLTGAERGLFTGGAVAILAVRSLLWALGIFVVFAPLAVRVYRRKT